MAEESPAPSVTGEELCRSFVEQLPVTGASISVIGGSNHHSTIYASDAFAARLDSMQFELGEGPRWTVLHTEAPVFVADVATDDHSDWPIFGAALRGSVAGALFAFPLVIGAATIGVVDLYHTTSGMLSARDVERALALARAVAAPAARRAVWAAGEDVAVIELAPELRREVHQATGMILAQLDTTATVAFARLRAHAFSSGRAVEDVARDVVARRLDFRDLPD